VKKPQAVRSPNLTMLPPIVPEDEELINVVIETPKGGRIKFKYGEEAGVFEVSKLLPKGMVFPFDFGFVPQTKADDGDPLDVLVLMDEPAFPGCVVRCRVIGVLEAEQTEGEDTHRNDRVIAVAQSSIDFAEIRHLEELSKSAVDQIEEFFISYNKQFGKELHFLDRKGPSVAWHRLNRSMGMRRAA
jgi:inorganic pyrophosphatase